MRLYLVKANGEVWWDAHEGFVIRATDASHARRIAHEAAHRRNGDEVSDNPNYWLERATSTCQELTEKGAPGVILTDFKRG